MKLYIVIIILVQGPQKENVPLWLVYYLCAVNDIMQGPQKENVPLWLVYYLCAVYDIMQSLLITVTIKNVL